jgi:hypothetical protein
MSKKAKPARPTSGPKHPRRSIQITDPKTHRDFKELCTKEGVTIGDDVLGYMRSRLAGARKKGSKK